jgi:hypothetical protein
MSEAWDDPIPLGASGPLPGFPVSAFPVWLADEVTETARFTQTPPDLAGSVALAMLSTAAGGRAVVEVRGTWREPVNLYTVVALPPGARKSPVFAEIVRPVFAAEAEMMAATRTARVEALTELSIAEKAADKAAHHAAAAENDKKNPNAREAARKKAVELAKAAAAIAVPVLPQLVADDTTPEATASLLAEQGGRISVLSAEGGIFSTLGGRYSEGKPNFDVFLKGHAGDPLRVNRTSRGPEDVPHPALTLGLCVQPEVLRDIARLPGFRGKGLLARPLYSLPPDLVGHRSVGEPGIPGHVRQAYDQAAAALARSLADLDEPAVLKLSPGAADLLLAEEEAIEPRLAADTGDLAGIRDWAAKLIGHTARIAGLLHLAATFRDGGGWDRPVSDETMKAAVEMGRYYLAHALAAFDHMGANLEYEDAQVILAWLERTLPARFTRREAHMGLSRARFPKAADLDAPLAVLEDHCYIRRDDEPLERTGPGRPPSPAYLVHPDLCHGNHEIHAIADSADSVVSVAGVSAATGAPPGLDDDSAGDLAEEDRW